MGDEDSRRLRKELQRLQDYIEDQRKRHNADIKAAKKDIADEVKYSKKLRTELEEEYKHCERLRKQLSDKTRLAEDLREDLDEERAYSEKLERKLDKRAKVIKELEADLIELELDYAEARSELKRMDKLRRELEDTKLLRQYAKQRVEQLQDQVRSLRSESRSSSPAVQLLPQIRSIRSESQSSSPSVQLLSHVRSVRSESRSSSPLGAPPTRVPASTTPSFRPAPLARSNTPELESDYSEDEGEYQDQDQDRLTEQEEVEAEVAEAEAEAAEIYSDGGVPAAGEEVDDAPGQKLRNLALREGQLADREYERQREAWTSGDKAFASKLKESGAQHRSAMKNYNNMAAAEIFNHHNPEYHTNPNSRTKIDLHHLFVREATTFVENHIELCRRGGIERTEIISGRGNHSIGGVAKIRPAIMEYLESQRDVEVDPHETNPGRIVVRLNGSGWPEEDRGDARPRGRTMRGGPEHAEVDDVFEHGRTRLRAATRAADEVRHDLDEIEQGMNTMRIKPESRRGLRDVTNYADSNE